ncbi:MAG: hypothetical protein ACOC23_00715, partial [Thermodesulfobacteriota bacterium]
LRTIAHVILVSSEFMRRLKKQTAALYLEYDQQRKIEEAKEADLQDDAELKALEAKIKKRKQ